MNKVYEVILMDDEPGELHINLTEEGVIMDVYNKDGDRCYGTWGRTAMELLDMII
jgi:hypothetical protein